MGDHACRRLHHSHSVPNRRSSSSSSHSSSDSHLVPNLYYYHLLHVSSSPRVSSNSLSTLAGVGSPGRGRYVGPRGNNFCNGNHIDASSSRRDLGSAASNTGGSSITWNTGSDGHHGETGGGSDWLGNSNSGGSRCK